MGQVADQLVNNSKLGYWPSAHDHWPTVRLAYNWEQDCQAYDYEIW